MVGILRTNDLSTLVIAGNPLRPAGRNGLHLSARLVIFKRRGLVQRIKLGRQKPVGIIYIAGMPIQRIGFQHLQTPAVIFVGYCPPCGILHPHKQIALIIGVKGFSAKRIRFLDQLPESVINITGGVAVRISNCLHLVPAVVLISGDTSAGIRLRNKPAQPVITLHSSLAFAVGDCAGLHNLRPGIIPVRNSGLSSGCISGGDQPALLIVLPQTAVSRRIAAFYRPVASVVAVRAN
ncbi:hypothetical protein D3C75_642410 [compost metagenome]